MRSWIVFYTALFFMQQLHAGTVDTVTIYSYAMHRNFKAVVIKPVSYSDKSRSFETVYLLHGWSGGFSNWIRRVPQLKDLADTYQMLIVCPEGGYSGWYLDSPLQDSMKFETHVAKEVPAYIEANYRTIKNRYARAITGLSMGGHGGLYLGFRHADFFGACGSMSGAFLIEKYTKPAYGVDKILGDTSNKVRYRTYSILQEMEHYPQDSIAIIMDCGVKDDIIEMSRTVHRRLLELDIPHDYIERPGKHEWLYWANAVQYQLLYFRNYFDRKKGLIK